MQLYCLNKNDLERLAKVDEQIFQSLVRVKDNYGDMHIKYDFSYYVFKSPGDINNSIKMKKMANRNKYLMISHKLYSITNAIQ